MTIVVFWLRKHFLHVLADTRISGGDHVYTDAGPKILLLNIHSRGKDLHDVKHRAFGFAYAGSSLAALSTYAVVSNCLANLRRKGEHIFPSVQDVALLVEAAANRYIEESKPPAPPLMFECVVFGACERENRPVAVSIAPELKEGKWRATSERAPLGEDMIGMLGQSEVFVERANVRQRAGHEFDPHAVIDEMIKDPAIPTVGGTRQMAIAGSWNVEIVPIGELDGEGPALKALITGIDATKLPAPADFSIGYQLYYPSSPSNPD